VLCLNQDVALLHEKIDDTQPSSNTNVCLGLYAAGQILKGPDSRDYTTDGEPVGKYIVLLTDGANVFNPHSSAPGDCWPTGVDDDAPPVPQRCGVGGGSTNEQLDVCTWELALALASDPDIVTPDGPLHIYVVGLNVNDGGPADDGETPADGICDDIGESDDDRRLLKCVATSTPDTNDHYFETDDANELGAIFQGIAYDIASRGLTSDSDE
jgi:hypothetical protein